MTLRTITNAGPRRLAANSLAALPVFVAVLLTFDAAAFSLRASPSMPPLLPVSCEARTTADGIDVPCGICPPGTACRYLVLFDDFDNPDTVVAMCEAADERLYQAAPCEPTVAGPEEQ